MVTTTELNVAHPSFLLTARRHGKALCPERLPEREHVLQASFEGAFLAPVRKGERS